MQLRILIVAFSLSITLSLQHSFGKDAKEVNFINDAIDPDDLDFKYYEIDGDEDTKEVRVLFNDTEYHSDSNGKKIMFGYYLIRFPYETNQNT